ncbi:MAG: alpha/beta hydrolase [Oscillospiraceae bacterium]|nr:alpha/beta hydrolase [Oscillospiraceae bacterium]
MRICHRELKPYPGYEAHVTMMLQTDRNGTVPIDELQRMLRSYELREGESMEDISIPGVHEGQTIALRIFRPAEMIPNAPVILDVHGGGFTRGSVAIDNDRCLKLARYSGCLVASVEYRLAGETVSFPEPLLDCHRAYLWLSENAASLGGDGTRLGLHGTSAGGGLCAGLALYLRDRGEPTPALTVLNCPTLDNVPSTSKHQFGSLAHWDVPYPQIGYVQYAGMNRGITPSYYALPNKCEDLRGLGPHLIVTAEYDPLRDEGLAYGLRLLETGIPCEMFSAPRVTHGFCAVDHPLSRWLHRGIAASFRREFGLEITEI